MASSTITKKEENINNEYKKEYTFKLLDFNILNKVDIDVDDDETDKSKDFSNDNLEEYEEEEKKYFMIQIFGLNEYRETVSIIVKNFKPFFYIKVPLNWDEKIKNRFIGFIKNKIGKYNEKYIYGAELIKKKKLYGFDAGKKHNFICIYFDNISVFNKTKGLWYEKTEFGENKKLIKEGLVFLDFGSTRIYESVIPPLLRLFHIKNISPSGWITLPPKKTEKIHKNMKETSCIYEYSIKYDDIIPLNNKETRVPYKICSFDIEASSSHGDFPVPKKTYKKLCQNIVDYLDKISDKSFKTNDLLRTLILAGFNYYNINGIDRIYPKNAKTIKRVHIEQLISNLINKSLKEIIVKLKNGNNAFDNILNIETFFEKENKYNISNCNDEDDNVYVENEDNNETEGIVDTETLTSKYKKPKIQETNIYSLIKQKDILKKTLLDLLLDSDLEREVKINEFNRLMILSNFPEIEGDKVTFIGSTFMSYGETTPYFNHCIVLNTCEEPVDDSIAIETYKTEKEVLLAWAELIQEEDPDIIIGYNIFGFDYQFMFHRAEENNCLADFLKLSRNTGEICTSLKFGDDKNTYRLEETTINIASGTHELKYIKMNGRLQIDMYNYLRRGENLTSYKLDYVSGYFIGDIVKKYETMEDCNSPMCKIYTKNFTGLTENSYIHFEEIGNTVEYYNFGEKFLVSNINLEESYFIIVGNLNISSSSKKKLRWCLAKDDVTPKDIFVMANGTEKDRFTIAKYCIQDCNLVHYLLNKIDVITDIVEMSNICSVPCSFIIFRGQGIKLTSYIFKKCREMGIVIPDINKGHMNDAYEGAIVLEPKCNLYLKSPIPVGDFASLYPSSMISENYSHDSKVWSKHYDLANNLLYEEGVKNKDGKFIYDNLPNYTYVDTVFDTYKYIRKDNKAQTLQKVISGYKICRYAQYPDDKVGVMPSILKELLKARKDTKKLVLQQTDDFMKRVYDKRQNAYKVTANSLYGQCGAKTSTFYEPDIAASTTSTGRMLLTYAKSIVEECYSDLICNTSQGLVHSCAEYVYGDTDSVFFTFNLKDMDGNPIEGKKSLELSIEIAQEACHLVSKFLKKPHDFEYEKTYFPFLLLSKKRYVGILYETNPDIGKRSEMGIVLKRRDNAPIVKDVYGGTIDILMKEQNIEKSIEFLKECLTNIVNKNYPIEKLIITKSLSSHYKKPNQICHKVLSDRISQRDPGNKPSSGDRIPYVYIHNPKALLQGDRIETPTFIKDNNLTIDYAYYITNQLMKPICQIYAIVLEQLYGTKNAQLLREYNSKVRKLKNTNENEKDKTKLNKSIEKLRNTEVKKILFDSYISECNNIKNKVNNITNYFTNNKLK